MVRLIFNTSGNFDTTSSNAHLPQLETLIPRMGLQSPHEFSARVWFEIPRDGASGAVLLWSIHPLNFFAHSSMNESIPGLQTFLLAIAFIFTTHICPSWIILKIPLRRGPRIITRNPQCKQPWCISYLREKYGCKSLSMTSCQPRMVASYTFDSTGSLAVLRFSTQADTGRTSSCDMWNIKHIGLFFSVGHRYQRQSWQSISISVLFLFRYSIEWSSPDKNTAYRCSLATVVSVYSYKDDRFMISKMRDKVSVDCSL